MRIKIICDVSTYLCKRTFISNFHALQYRDPSTNRFQSCSVRQIGFSSRGSVFCRPIQVQKYSMMYIFLLSMTKALRRSLLRWQSRRLASLVQKASYWSNIVGMLQASFEECPVSKITYLNTFLRLLVSINASISQVALFVEAPSSAQSLKVMSSLLGREEFRYICPSSSQRSMFSWTKYAT